MEDKELSFDFQKNSCFSKITTKDIFECNNIKYNSLVQDNIVIFTAVIDINKLYDEIIDILSDESKYSPDVNILLQNEAILKNDNFPTKLGLISIFSKLLSAEKLDFICNKISQIEDAINNQYIWLDTEYSGFLKPEELSLVEIFFEKRLNALRFFNS